MEFYDQWADYYDTMTRFSERLQSEKNILVQWQKKLGCYNVVDAGCGTGLHAVGLALLGLTVTAIDPAEKMLTRAAEQAHTYGVQIRFACETMQHLHRVVAPASQDAVFSLGNTIPHLLTKNAIRTSFRRIHQCLKPGGAFIMQLLNYDNILVHQDRIINVTTDKDLHFVRFYDFLKTRLRFNILVSDERNRPGKPQLFSTVLYPYRKEELQSLLRQAGFFKLEVYGSLSMSPYTASSPNLVMCAFKRH
jgi:glycine/sarcosine N-methyltransferase